METNQEGTFLQMHLDHDGGHILRDTVRWSRFLAIVGFVCLGIGVLAAALASTALMTVFSRYAPGLDAMGGIGAAILMVCVLIGAAIFGFVFYMLYRFSTLTRRGIENQDQATFVQGMRCLKIYFLVYGIFAMLGLLANLFSLTQLFHS